MEENISKFLKVYLYLIKFCVSSAALALLKLYLIIYCTITCVAVR